MSFDAAGLDELAAAIGAPVPNGDPEALFSLADQVDASAQAWAAHADALAGLGSQLRSVLAGDTADAHDQALAALLHGPDSLGNDPAVLRAGAAAVRNFAADLQANQWSSRLMAAWLLATAIWGAARAVASGGESLVEVAIARVRTAAAINALKTALWQRITAILGELALNAGRAALLGGTGQLAIQGFQIATGNRQNLNAALIEQSGLSFAEYGLGEGAVDHGVWGLVGEGIANSPARSVVTRAASKALSGMGGNTVATLAGGGPLTPETFVAGALMGTVGALADTRGRGSSVRGGADNAAHTGSDDTRTAVPASGPRTASHDPPATHEGPPQPRAAAPSTPTADPAGAAGDRAGSPPAATAAREGPTASPDGSAAPGGRGSAAQSSNGSTASGHNWPIVSSVHGEVAGPIPGSLEVAPSVHDTAASPAAHLTAGVDPAPATNTPLNAGAPAEGRVDLSAPAPPVSAGPVADAGSPAVTDLVGQSGAVGVPAASPEMPRMVAPDPTSTPPAAGEPRTAAAASPGFAVAEHPSHTPPPPTAEADTAAAPAAEPAALATDRSVETRSTDPWAGHSTPQRTDPAGPATVSTAVGPTHPDPATVSPTVGPTHLDPARGGDPARVGGTAAGTPGERPAHLAPARAPASQRPGEGHSSPGHRRSDPARPTGPRPGTRDPLRRSDTSIGRRPRGDELALITAGHQPDPDPGGSNKPPGSSPREEPPGIDAPQPARPIEGPDPGQRDAAHRGTDPIRPKDPSAPDDPHNLPHQEEDPADSLGKVAGQYDQSGRSDDLGPTDSEFHQQNQTYEDRGAANQANSDREALRDQGGRSGDPLPEADSSELSERGPSAEASNLTSDARAGENPHPNVADAEHQPSGDDDRRRALQQRLANLTGPEREALRRLATGHTDDEVAQALDLGEGTAPSHAQHIAAKLDAEGTHRGPGEQGSPEDAETAQERLANLIVRERDVLRAMARGLTAEEVAQASVRDEGTAPSHVQRILAKLDAEATEDPGIPHDQGQETGPRKSIPAIRRRRFVVTARITGDTGAGGGGGGGGSITAELVGVQTTLGALAESGGDNGAVMEESDNLLGDALDKLEQLRLVFPGERVLNERFYDCRMGLNEARDWLNAGQRTLPSAMTMIQEGHNVVASLLGAGLGSGSDVEALRAGISGAADYLGYAQGHAQEAANNLAIPVDDLNVALNRSMVELSATLQAKVSDEESELRQDRDDLRLVQEYILRARETMVAATEQIAETYASKVETEAELRATARQYNESDEAIHEIGRRLHTVQQAIGSATLDIEYSETPADVHRYESSRSGLMREAETLETELNIQNALRSSLNSSLEELGGRRDQMTQNVDRLESLKRGSEIGIRSYEATENTLRETIERRESTIRTMKEARSAVSEINEKIAQARGRIDRILNRIRDEVIPSVAQQAGQLSEIQARL